MKFDTKIAIAVRDDLAVWQKLNMTAFLASGIAGNGGPMGEPYADGSGRAYRPMFRQPVMVLTGGGPELRACYDRAHVRGLAMAIFTDPLFATGHDEANRAALAATPAETMSIAGFAVYGPKNDVDRAMKGLKLHP
jgi:hypothetical protein